MFHVEAWEPGEPRWVTEDLDLDPDGTPDLLLADDRITGTGGRGWWAFLRTPSGFRFIGMLGGTIRSLPAVGGHPRFATADHISSGEVGVALAELRDDGLHRLASAVLAAGDQGTDAGSRLYEELMLAPAVSVDALRYIFGSEAYPLSGRVGTTQGVEHVTVEPGTYGFAAPARRLTAEPGGYATSDLAALWR